MLRSKKENVYRQEKNAMIQRQSKIVLFGAIFFSLFAIAVLIEMENLRLSVFAVLEAIIIIGAVQQKRFSKTEGFGIFFFLSFAVYGLVFSESPTYWVVFVCIAITFSVLAIKFLKHIQKKKREDFVYLKEKKKNTFWDLIGFIIIVLVVASINDLLSENSRIDIYLQIILDYFY